MRSLSRDMSPSSSVLPIAEVADRTSPQTGIPKAVVADGVQSIVTEFKNGYYAPFAVQVGVPLRWTIRIKAEEINGCNNPMRVPAYGIERRLVPGDNLVEFTPKKEGAIVYSCWMGMIRSVITVVRDPVSSNVAAPLAKK
jgi:plastocyanin domain-containing protein